jgi:hypothetical protein
MVNFARLIPLFSAALLLPISGEAQYHQKGTDGSTSVRQMNNPYSRGPGSFSPGLTNKGIRSSNVGAVVLTPDAVQKARAAGVKSIGIDTIPLKDADVWGRAENHPDGTYTETIFDDNPENQQYQNLVVQKTRKKSLSGDDPVILTRKISLNQLGQPAEVRIYEGDGSSGRYKYHGKFIYDSRGRLIEQQLRDSQGKPLRRVIQDYTTDGTPLPLKTVDYASNFPSDLQLVVSRDNPEILEDKLKRLEKDAHELAGWNKKLNLKGLKGQDNNASSPGTTQSTQKKRFQLFKNRN